MFTMGYVESKDRGFSDIRIAVLKVSTESGDEWFEEFDVIEYFLKEVKGSPTDIPVWTLLESQISL